MSPSTLITLLMATLALAAPTPAPRFRRSLFARESCDTSTAKLTVPAGQTAITNPTSNPSFVMLGVGFQNYTCGAAGTYTTAGATADLYDISCLSKNPAQFDDIQNVAMTAWSGSTASTLGTSVTGNTQIGFHFFQPNPAGGVSPVWDLRAIGAKDNADAFVVAARVGATPAPDGTQNVDWVQLKGTSGSLAGTVYRSHTVLGQPPASCQPGSAPIQVKYTSKYWIYDSKVAPAAPAPAPATSVAAPAATPTGDAADDAADAADAAADAADDAQDAKDDAADAADEAKEDAEDRADELADAADEAADAKDEAEERKRR